MLATMQFLATFCCAVFSGAAVYVNLVEHPARVSCGVAVALPEWAPSYKRGTLMQAPLAVLGFLFSVGAWLSGAGTWVLLGGLLLFAVVPFTLLVIAPTNKKLLTLDASKEGEAMALLARWNRLHAVRSLLGVAALVVLLLSHA